MKDSFITYHIRYIEKYPSQKLLDGLFKYAKDSGIDLSPWSKRIDALKKKIIIHEVMKS
jgi:hypothetical protein